MNIKSIMHPNILLLFSMKRILNRERKYHHKNEMPIHYTIDNNSRDMLELLISKGADINAKDIVYHIINVIFFNNII